MIDRYAPILTALFCIFSLVSLGAVLVLRHSQPVLLEESISPEINKMITSAQLEVESNAEEFKPFVSQSSSKLDIYDAELIETGNAFEDLLNDYKTADLDDEKAHLLESKLIKLNSNSEGRALLIDMFFSWEDQELSDALYKLILDSDFKDSRFIVELIVRDKQEFDSSYSTKIIDLIANLNTNAETEYDPVIEAYLDGLAINPNPKIRATAIARRAWYVAGDQEKLAEVIDSYVFDRSKMVRQELYGIIESEARGGNAEQRQMLAQRLTSLQYAPHLGIDENENGQIHRLVSMLRK